MTARKYGRLPVTIGKEMADAGLTPNARLLYMTLEAQLKISACGLLERQDRRWVRDTGLTAGDVDDALIELDAAGFVLVDDDTLEVLVVRHVRDDIQVTNSKIVQGVWNSIDRIESDRLRAGALANLTSLPEEFPPPDRPINRTDDRPIHRPMDRSPDRPESSSLEPSSSSPPPEPVDATHLSVDNPGDDDEDLTSNPDDPDARADLACILIGDQDYDRARTDGRTITSPTSYRNACRAQARTTWHADAARTAETNPDWGPADIAQYLTAPHRLPAPSAPPAATARAPDVDLRTIPVHQTSRGAAIVDLDAARTRTAN